MAHIHKTVFITIVVTKSESLLYLSVSLYTTLIFILYGPTQQQHQLLIYVEYICSFCIQIDPYKRTEFLAESQIYRENIQQTHTRRTALILLPSSTQTATQHAYTINTERESVNNTVSTHPNNIHMCFFLTPHPSSFHQANSRFF